MSEVPTHTAVASHPSQSLNENKQHAGWDYDCSPIATIDIFLLNVNKSVL